MNLRFLPIPLLLIAALPAPDARAATVVVNSAGRGWYDSAGYAGVSDNYQVGLGGAESRAWFLFDLSSLSGTVTAASFTVFEPLGGYTSEDSFGEPLNATETVGLFAASSTGLAADGTGGHAAIFNDLGDGVSYGTLAVSAADDGTTLTFAFNSAGIAALNAAKGLTFAFGAKLLSADADPSTNQYVFNGSQTGLPSDGGTRLLITTAVPKPAPGAVCAATLVLAALRLRRRR